MEPHRIELAASGGFNDPLCEELSHFLDTREMPK
jgi:hypothetical protein